MEKGVWQDRTSAEERFVSVVGTKTGAVSLANRARRFSEKRARETQGGGKKSKGKIRAIMGNGGESREKERRERKSVICTRTWRTHRADKPGLVWNLLLAITLVIVSCNMHGNSRII